MSTSGLPMQEGGRTVRPASRRAGRATSLVSLAVCALMLSAWVAVGGAQGADARPEQDQQRRGIHVLMGPKAEVPHVERLIDLSAVLGLNWLILEVNSNFAYQSHPEVAEPDSMDAEDAHRLAKLAREKGIRLVPQYQCLGHQSWREDTGALLRAHPEFNEAPDLDPSARGFYCMSWCPNHPDLNPLIFDLFDELLEAFEADAFHVGMDEVFILGQCERCKGTPNAELFAKAVNDYHAHLVGRRGVEMLMWGDRLLDAEAMGYGRYDASRNDTWQAIDMIPKDIVMCDWHYGLKDDYPSVRYFQQKGFRVWPAGWNEEDAVRRFVEVSRKDASEKMVGYLATTWISLEDVVTMLAAEQVKKRNRRAGDIATCVGLVAELTQEGDRESAAE
jgi:hypothetical protein